MVHEKVLLQFNKISGAFITWMSYVDIDTLNQTYFTYKELDNFDNETQTIEGTVDDYKVVNLVDQRPKVYESTLNVACRSKIIGEYSTETQLDRIRLVVEQMANFLVANNKDLAIEGLEALTEMNAFIDEVKESNRKLKLSYQTRDDFDYISIPDEVAERDAQMEGGLHELVYGPRAFNV